MVLTRKQEEALKISVARYRQHERWTCIAGAAGVGKSSVVPFIIDALGLDPDSVCYIAYTGKAARVLQEKGCQHATTAHKFLYWAVPDKNGIYHYRRKPKNKLDFLPTLIVIDEVSMLPMQLWQDLLTLHIPIIALGDPFQLPSITEDCGVLKHPHIFLDEIMRQAKDSEIIQLTMDLREGKDLPLFKGNEVQILPASALNEGMLNWADQVLCAKNVTRKKINNLQRERLFGLSEQDSPIVGDKIICLHNDYTRESEKYNDNLVNGMIGTLATVQYEPDDLYGTKMTGLFTYDNDCFEDLLIDYDIFHGEESFFERYLKSGLGQNKKRRRRKKDEEEEPPIVFPAQFDYGYAITTWKAQGSEWDKVLVLEEDFPRDTVEHMRFMYTAATRAKKKLVVIKNARI